MDNPFAPSHLMEASSTFGTLAWTFYLLQATLAAGGIYLKFARQDRNSLRKKLLDQLGIAIMSIGVVGVLLGALRLMDVSLFNQRFWFYLLAFIEIMLAAYVFYYARVIYPEQLRQTATSRSKGTTNKRTAQTQEQMLTIRQSTQNGASQGKPTEPLFSQTSRREARRERKRKKR